MVYYVVYRAPRETKGRSLIPRRLRALDCKQLGKSFWEIGEKESKANKVLKALQKNYPILLKRERQIRKPHFVKEEDAYDVGSLVIVAYRMQKKVKREKIRKFLKRAPCLRLCRSVYAFYQQHSRFDKENKLVDAQRFQGFIQEMHGEVEVVPRVVIVNLDSVGTLLEEIKERVENEVSDIIKGYKELYYKILNEEFDKQLARSTMTKLNGRFRRVRRVASFYEKWLKMDFSKSLIRPYRAVQKVSSLLSSE